MSKRPFRLTARFCGNNVEANAERACAHIGPDASAAACAKTLTACGWQTRTLSAELRVAMYEACADELADSDSVTLQASAAQYRAMVSAVREPTAWYDIAPFHGRRAGEP